LLLGHLDELFFEAVPVLDVERLKFVGVMCEFKNGGAPVGIRTAIRVAARLSRATVIDRCSRIQRQPRNETNARPRKFVPAVLAGGRLGGLHFPENHSGRLTIWV
jgi:hypothetical protein